MSDINKFLYELYKRDWCKQRNISFDSVDKETEKSGINGEMYVCYKEFMFNELKEEPLVYIKKILQLKNNFSKEELVEQIHDWWLDYKFTNETEEILYTFLDSIFTEN